MGFAAPEPRVVELQTRGRPAVDHRAQDAVADRVEPVPVARRRIAPEIGAERHRGQGGKAGGQRYGDKRCKQGAS